jgi:hypothetical protein
MIGAADRPLAVSLSGKHLVAAYRPAVLKFTETEAHENIGGSA